jgi:tetratricopeptide (TPR) repeat protein
MSRKKIEERKARKAKKKDTKEASFEKKPIWLLLTIVLGFVAYSSIYENKVTNYDDDIYVTENAPLRNLEVNTLFTEFYWNQYSPLAMTIMGIEFKVSDANEKFLRFMSVLIHVLCALVIFLLIRHLVKDDLVAGLTSLLFVVHPLNVESVAWLTASMKIGTYALFFLLSVYSYLRYLETDKKSFILLSFVFFLASCFSKEQAVVLPVLLLAIDYFKGRKLTTKDVWIQKIPFFLLSMIFGYITLQASSSSEVASNAVIVYNFGFAERVLFAFYATGMYVLKLIAPLELSMFYTYPVKGEIPAYFYVVPLLVIGLLFGLFKAYRAGHKWIAFGLLFFFINVFLTSLTAVMSVRDVIMADRYVYLPSVGLFFILSYFIVVKMKERFKPGLYVILGLALILSAMTYQRTQVWKDSVTLFSDVIDKGAYANRNNPYLALAYNNRGIEYKRAGKIDLAMSDYSKAIESDPKYPNGYLNRGNIYFDSGKDDLALQDYNTVLQLQENAKAYSARGAIFARRQQYDAAIEDMNKAIQSDKYFIDAYSNRAITYLEMGRFDDAIADCTTILNMAPNRAGIYELRAYLKQRKGDHAAAIIDFDRSIQLDGSQAPFYFNRGISHRATGNKAAALRDLQKASSMGYPVPADVLNSVKN